MQFKNATLSFRYHLELWVVVVVVVHAEAAMILLDCEKALCG